ncbi:FIVAR domain-containing protein [Xylanibacter brevis]|uniref:FIVAR domain-containing protein n=1 Tax=Xylanibacter brevis TaxID=83231 RepID=UPI000486DC16|nr:FIVAR domain-containing protein [Xylanibacter brevis]
MKRKLTFVLGLLIASLTGSVFAQSFDEQKTYSICNRNDANIFMQDNGTGKVALGSFNDNSYWKLIATGNENCYYVQNAVTQKYMQSTAGIEVEVNTGDTPVEISIILCTDEGEGMYGMASTDQATYDFKSGTIGANWKEGGVVQGFAAVSGTNHRSFWKIVEAAMPEPSTDPDNLKSLTGNDITTGSDVYLFNIDKNVWLQNNDRLTSNWTTRAEVGSRGLDFNLTTSNGAWIINPKFGSNHSVNAADDLYYLDTTRPVSFWSFTPTTIDGYKNVYTINSGDTKLSVNDDKNLVANGNAQNWQLFTRAERLAQLETATEPVDVSWLIQSPDFANADERFSAWEITLPMEGATANRVGDASPSYNCNRMLVVSKARGARVLQTITGIPNGYYALQAQGVYSPSAFDMGPTNRRLWETGELPIGAHLYMNGKTIDLPCIYSESKTANESGFQKSIDGRDGEPTKFFPGGNNQVSRDFFDGYFKTGTIMFNVTDGQLTIGVTVDDTELDGQGREWFAVDNFKLVYCGKLSAALKSAINNAEAFDATTTTTVLATELSKALNDAKAKQDSEDVDEITNATNTLNAALDAAKALNIAVLKATVTLAETEGITIPTSVEDYIANGTSNDDSHLRLIRNLRKLNAIEKVDISMIECSEPANEEADYYLYNVGAGIFFSTTADWGTHIALDNPGMLIHFRPDGEWSGAAGRPVFHLSGNGWNGMNWSEEYWDKNGENKLAFVPVEGKEKVYNLCEWDNYNWHFVYDPADDVCDGNTHYWNSVQKRDWNRDDYKDNPYAQWMLVSPDAYKTAMMKASAQKPLDVTFLINNPNFSKANVDGGWTRGWEGVGGQMRGADREPWMVIEWFESSADMSQTITGLAPGKYIASCYGFYRDGDANNEAAKVKAGEELVKNAFFFANDQEIALPNVTSEAGKMPGVGEKREGVNGEFACWPWQANEYFQTGLYKVSLPVEVGQEGTLRIGIKSEYNNVNGSWVVAGNFRLTSLGSSIDLGVLLTSLGNAIADAEAFDTTTTTTALATALTQALNDAKTKLISQDAEEIVAATNTLNAALNVAKLVNIEVLKATADLAKTEVDADALASVTKFLNDATTAAETAIAEATTAGAIEQALYDLSAARKINALSTTGTYKGSEPKAGKVYLFNVGTGMFLGTGSDWNTHAAVDQVGIEIELVDLDKPETNNFKFKTDRGGGWMNYKGYVDTPAQDIWHFLPVDGQEGVYNISSNGQDGFLLGYNPNKGTDGKKYWSNIGIDQTGLDNPMNQWIIVTPAERTAMIEDASEENPVDVSYLIKNASLNRQDGYDMWNKQCTGGNGGARVSTTTDGNGDRAADYAYEFFEPENFSFTQSLEGLKAGKYVVAVQGFFRNGNGDAQREAFNAGEEAVQLAYLMANDEKEFLPNITDELDLVPALTDVIKSDKGAFPNMPNAAIEYFQHGAYWTTVEVEVEEDGKLTLGVKKDERQEMGDWTVIDNFRLIYMGEIEKVDSALLAAKDSLAALIATAKAIDTTGKTSESVSALNTAISDAETALAAEDATVESLTTAKTNLQTAINNLADIVDGINVIEAATKAGKVYNTQGQKVNKTQKGVYIINGKKTVVK